MTWAGASGLHPVSAQASAKRMARFLEIMVVESLAGGEFDEKNGQG
jgi:hypothetical protein